MTASDTLKYESLLVAAPENVLSPAFKDFKRHVTETMVVIDVSKSSSGRHALICGHSIEQNRTEQSVYISLPGFLWHYRCFHNYLLAASNEFFSDNVDTYTDIRRKRKR